MSETASSTATAPVPWEVRDSSSEFAAGVSFVDNHGWQHELAFSNGRFATIVITPLGAVVGPAFLESEDFGGYPVTAEARIGFGNEYARQLREYLEAEGV